MKKERWLSVVGYEGLYEVSDQGRVRGLDRQIRHPRGSLRLWPGRVLRASPMSNGYLQVSLCKDGNRAVRTLHSVVAEAFHGLAPPKQEVAHDNGERYDCRASNLSWKTRAANHADKVRHGTTNRGERQGLSKMTDAKVRRARRLARIGHTHARIAALSGVSRSNISRIIRGEQWSHV